MDGPPVFIQELSSKAASVDGPPVFIRELSNVMNGTVGSPAVLQCSISSQSNPLLVTWYKDSQRLPPGSHFQQTCNGNTEQLVISKTNQTDSGQYECEASNKFGKVSSAYRLTLKEGKIYIFWPHIWFDHIQHCKLKKVQIEFDR